MADDYVLYNVDEFYSPLTFSSIDEVVEYGKKLGFNSKECDDFATKVFNYEIGQKFVFKDLKFIVWDDEWGGYHQFHASTKKSKSQPKSFSDMVKKQRNKGLAKTDETSLATFFEGIYSEIGDIADRIKEINNSNSKDSGIYYKIDNIRTTLIHSIQSQIEDLMRRL